MLTKPLCDLFGDHHYLTDDPYQYLDCYWYYRCKDTKGGLRKEPIVERWDKDNPEWVISKS